VLDDHEELLQLRGDLHERRENDDKGPVLLSRENLAGEGLHDLGGLHRGHSGVQRGELRLHRGREGVRRRLVAARSLSGRVLQHVGQCQRMAEHDRVQFADGREQRTQACFEAWEFFDRVFVAGAGHDGFDGGVAAPEVRAAQGASACDFHGQACCFS